MALEGKKQEGDDMTLSTTIGTGETDKLHLFDSCGLAHNRMCLVNPNTKKCQ